MLPYNEGNTTAIVGEYVAQLAQLPVDAPQETVVRELLSRAVVGYIYCVRPSSINATLD